MLKILIKKNRVLKKIALWLYRNIFIITKNGNFIKFYRIFPFFYDYYKFYKAGGHSKFMDLYPCLSDKTTSTSIDSHYFHQAIWGFNRIMRHGSKKHVDIGSDVRFVGMLTNISNVTFVDIRPLKLNIKNYSGKAGSILDLPYEDGSINSLSCLHVIEHIGLGRYGDPIDPMGSIKASSELIRVLGTGGYLFLSVPLGEESIQFNSQRIFSYEQVIRMFSDLKLLELSVVDMNGDFIENIDITNFKFDHTTGQDAGLGLFVFKK